MKLAIGLWYNLSAVMAAFFILMLTREQKVQQVDMAGKLLTESRNLIFIDFTGTGVESLRKLKKVLKEVGARLKVIKKKLLRVAFQKNKFDFNPEQFDSQVGTIFSDKDISEIAGPVYRFSKGAEEKGFKILGAYNLPERKFFGAAIIKEIGQLPAREVLLRQLVGILLAPIKMLMRVLQEQSKKVG